MAGIVPMPRTVVQASAPHTESRNRLLAAIPGAELAQLTKRLVTLPTRSRQTFQRAGEPIRYVYFPHGGVFSLTTAFPEGAFAEAAAVGREGVLGIEAFFGDRALAAGDVVLQIPGGTVERLDVDVFRGALAERGALHAIVGRYAAALLAQTMQAAVCNALHNVDERLAKWLLLADDRLDGPSDLRLSHEALALVLGTRRQTVTGIARAFQRAGLIAYKHARVTVLDRHGLEAAACACYRVIRDQVEHLYEQL